MSRAGELAKLVRERGLTGCMTLGYEIAAELERLARLDDKALPEWRRKLNTLLIADEPNEPSDVTLLNTLKELDILCKIIKSCKGEAIIPEGVARFMSIDGGGHHPAGLWIPEDEYADWVAVDRPNGIIHMADNREILAAIKKYANTLI